jgi:hypothetical protein
MGEILTVRVGPAGTRPDGALLAEITNVGDLLDLAGRCLPADPGARWRAIVASPGFSWTVTADARPAVSSLSRSRPPVPRSRRRTS